MESRRAKLSRKKSVYGSKVKKATQMLFYKRHQKPGVKGWELRKALGSDYPKVLDLLDNYLKPLDLQVKTVFEEEKAPEKPTLEDLDKARFYVALRGDLPSKDKLMGWRIDDLAGLGITISYIISHKGLASRKDVERILSEKMPNWKIGFNIDRYIRYGYLGQDDHGQLFLDWRTQAEIDQKILINMILSSETQEAKALSEFREKQEEEETEKQENK
jgi:hypothetical protein